LLGVTSDGMLSFVEKTVRKFKSFAEGEKSDRDFYKKLSPQERLNILLQLSKHEPERRDIGHTTRGARVSGMHSNQSVLWRIRSLLGARE